MFENKPAIMKSQQVRMFHTSSLTLFLQPGFLRKDNQVCLIMTSSHTLIEISLPYHPASTDMSFKVKSGEI